MSGKPNLTCDVVWNSPITVMLFEELLERVGCLVNPT